PALRQLQFWWGLVRRHFTGHYGQLAGIRGQGLDVARWGGGGPRYQDRWKIARQSFAWCVLQHVAASIRLHLAGSVTDHRDFLIALPTPEKRAPAHCHPSNRLCQEEEISDVKANCYKRCPDVAG